MQRVAKAIAEKTCNALLLKVPPNPAYRSYILAAVILRTVLIISYSMCQVNQIGSVTESIEAVKMSKKAGWGVMTSHRR